MVLRSCFLTPAGAVTLSETDGQLTHLQFCYSTNADVSPVLEQARHQLAEYFSGTRRTFSLPLHPKGTPFQQTVWQALQQIPYGETRSYGEVAQMIGNPNACRAVGLANNRNPLAIFIPCHRVIGTDGRLTGYAGGLHVKRLLLSLEAEHK
jgi:methylated-DNA-[protein]-cysteine S-methyltransferase